MLSTDIIILALISIIIAGAVTTIYYIQHLNTEYTKQLQDLQDKLQTSARSTSAQRSTIKGQLAEQMYPLSEQCPYLLSDMQFIGKAFDYLIIDGYTDCKDDGGDIRGVIFAEIKSGKAQLSRHQRAIRDAINAGKVRWETIHI